MWLRGVRVVGVCYFIGFCGDGFMDLGGILRIIFMICMLCVIIMVLCKGGII